MRWMEACWSCAVVFALQAVLAGMSEAGKHKSGKGSYNDQPNLWPQMFRQEVLILASTTSTASHPKITPAPVFKRKLGSTKWDFIHEGIQAQKRDAASCPTDYQMCPQSLNGGCCPNDRVCGSSSCFATIAGPASACGMAGYFACDINDGGGCCPTSYVCARTGCSPSAGVSYTQTCDASSYLCPASLGYGCCKNGMACGISNCYSTDVVTFTMTETVTTTEAGSVQTLISAIVMATTPQAPSTISSTGDSGVIPKVTANPAAEIAKTKASGTSGGGLGTPTIVGIIIGAIIILLIVLIAAFIIIRRLNKAIITVEAHSRSSSSNPRSRPSGQRPPPEVDAMSVDPLMMAPSVSSQSIRNPSQPSAIHSSHHEVEASTPPYFHSPFSPRSPPFNNYGGYAAVATSDSSGSGYRNPSLDSTPGLHQSPVGYFDIPPRPDLRDQNLRFGHGPGPRPNKHERQWSESSDQSLVSLTSSSVQELDAGQDGDRRSSLQRALQGMGLGRIASRRKSSTPSSRPRARSDPPIVLTGGPTGRPEWAANPNALGHIAEAGESRLDLQEIPSSGMATSGPREMAMVEQQAFIRRTQQDPRYQGNGGQGMELLRDVDLR